MNRKVDNERILVFDTTLRDGEQSPGASMNEAEKLRIALMLEKMRVDIIEAGFPIASKGDYATVKTIANSVKESVVCGLARAKSKDIETAGKALKKAEQPRIHTFIATSELHMRHKLRMSSSAVISAIEDSVGLARKFTDDVEWSAEDASRTDKDFLCRCVETAIDAGARTINIPDTVGYAVPGEFGNIIESISNRVPNIDKAIISVHCHNDLGLAVANTLSALAAGARQIECTINGIGERAGNAALEELVMAINTRIDRLPYYTNVKTENIVNLSRAVSSVTGIKVQANKAIVGKNAFSHESGIHQDGILKKADTYEIIRPSLIGLQKSSLILGKHSGCHAFRKKVVELGYELTEQELQDAFSQFKMLADKKKEVKDADIIAMLESEAIPENEYIGLIGCEVTSGTPNEVSTARLTLAVNGEQKTDVETGSGALKTAFGAVRKIYPHDAELLHYEVHAVTSGTDALAEAVVSLRIGSKFTNGKGTDTDTMIASLKAYVSALNKIISAGDCNENRENVYDYSMRELTVTGRIAKPLTA